MLPEEVNKRRLSQSEQASRPPGPYATLAEQLDDGELPQARDGIKGHRQSVAQAIGAGGRMPVDVPILVHMANSIQANRAEILSFRLAGHQLLSAAPARQDGGGGRCLRDQEHAARLVAAGAPRPGSGLTPAALDHALAETAGRWSKCSVCGSRRTWCPPRIWQPVHPRGAACHGSLAPRASSTRSRPDSTRPGSRRAREALAQATEAAEAELADGPLCARRPQRRHDPAATGGAEPLLSCHAARRTSSRACSASSG